MAIKFDYDKNNKNAAERGTTTYKIESPTKITVDNSGSIMYNKNKSNMGIKTPVTDFANQWKEKNQGALKYAGDSAKKSINAGLKEAPDYMQEADEGTSFENVQTASVK